MNGAAAAHDGDGVRLITVRSALQVPALRAGAPRVLAGEKGLDRAVRWVHAAEVPNIASLLKGGELLLTTGMGIGRTAREQRRLIAALADRGIAGLAIELGTVFGDMPPPLRAAADERDLPLIAVNAQVRFVEITEAIHREIVNRQFLLMRRGDELHRRFTELMLDGAGIPEVLSALAQTIANPVILHREGRGILYHAIHRSPDGEVIAAWNAPGGVDHVALPVRMNGDEAWGELVALALDSPLDDVDRVAMERAVGLVALALLRSRQEELLAARERGNLLARLLEAELDECEVRAAAAGAGFDGRQAWLLPVAVRGSCHDERLALVLHETQRELRSARMPIIAGVRAVERDLLVVVGLAAPGRRAATADRVAAAVRAAAARHVGGAVSIAVGAAVDSWRDVPGALGDAVEAAGLATPGPGWRDATRPDLDRLLWSMRDRPELRAFVDRRLGPLVEHDARRSLQLLETLQAYCECGGRKAAAARALHLERQSLYHRIERIEQLLGDDLSDEETYLGLHLALRARRYLAADGPLAPATPFRRSA